MDSVSVINNDTAFFHLVFELLHRRLVQDDGNVIFVQYGRADAVVAQDDGYVGCAAPLFWAVRRHPTDFLSFHQAGISQDFTH